jgi:acyl dehydratase
MTTLTGPRTLLEGDVAPTTTFGPVTRTDLVRYAGAGGDFNPIHHDEGFAREAGLDTVFAMGMFHAGVLARDVAAWLGRENVRRLEFRFTGQVWPGDELTITGGVDAVRETDEGRVADCSFALTRQTGDVALTAKVVAAVA